MRGTAGPGTYIQDVGIQDVGLRRVALRMAAQTLILFAYAPAKAVDWV